MGINNREFDDAILNNKKVIPKLANKYEDEDGYILPEIMVPELDIVTPIPLSELYLLQLENQMLMIKNKVYDNHLLEGIEQIPADNPGMTSYHMLHLLSELGEVLEADKRWKSHRRDKFDLNEKQDEIMDLLIISLNLAIYSGIEINDLEQKLLDKMLTNRKRLEEKA